MAPVAMHRHRAITEGMRTYEDRGGVTISSELGDNPESISADAAARQCGDFSRDDAGFFGQNNSRQRMAS